MNKPFTIVFTSQQCSHCNHFRGDGKPSEDKDWNPSLIKDFLKQSLSLTEINLDKMSPDMNNIIQFNEYTKNGDKLIRAIFLKENDKIKYSVEVNGVYSEELSKKLKMYNWDLQLPSQLKKIRENIIKGDKISSLLKEKAENEHVRQIFEQIKRKLSLEEYDNLLDNEFNYKWWLNNNIPSTLGSLIPFYPCWLFVSKDEWHDSIESKDRSIYAHVSSCTVLQSKDDGSYEVKMTEDMEDPLETVKKINSGEYSLSYKK